MSNFNTYRLTDFGGRNNVEFEGLIAAPDDEIPASLIDEYIVRHEHDRELRMGSARARILTWKKALESLKNSDEMAMLLSGRSEIQRLLSSSGKVSAQVLQTEVLIQKTVQQIEKAMDFIEKFMVKEKGKPNYTTENLNTARIASGAPLRELIALPKSLQLSGMGDENEERLLVGTPPVREIFLATKSKQVAEAKKEQLIEQLFATAMADIEKWVQGTQLLTMSDLTRLLSNMKKLLDYFGAELEEMTRFGNVVKGMNEKGYGMDEVKRVIDSYQFTERRMDFHNACQHLERILSFVMQRMRTNNANNRILSDEIDGEMLDRMFTGVRVRRKEFGITLNKEACLGNEAVILEAMRLRGGKKR